MASPRDKHLIFAVLDFLDRQVQSSQLSSDAKESLEVATQCLETAYGVNYQEARAGSAFPLPAPLPDVFFAGLEQMRTHLVTDADKEAAEKLKMQGNELLKQDKHQEAVECYTKAIEFDGRNAVFYCNRAAAYGKMGDNLKSLNDCAKALELDPNYSKAFGRKGLAHVALGQHNEAKECFRKALELDPVNDGYKENLRHTEQLLREQSSGPAGVGGGGLNYGGVNLSQLFSNPALMNMATSMLANPQMQSLMSNLMTGGSAGNPPTPGSMSDLLQAGQQLAQQMQAANPELVEQLRAQFTDRTTPPTDPSQNP